MVDTAANATQDKPEVKDEPKEQVCEEFKLKRSWTLWEHFEKPQGWKNNDYNLLMAKVCWFEDLISMSVACNTIPHFQLSNIFYNDETQTSRL